MNILGVDPGTKVVGAGIIKVSSAPNYVFHDSLFLGKIKGHSEKLVEVFNFLTNLIRNYSINVIALEKAYYGKDYHASELLNQVRGVVFLLAGLNKIDIYEYPPAKVKKTVTGDGRADKASVSKVVELTLSRKIQGSSDATDALAIALCHYYITKEMEKYAGLS